MITTLRFYASYDPLKRGFIAFKMNIISIRKRWHRRCQWRFASSLYMYTVKTDHFIWNLWNEPSASFIHLIWNDHHSKILCILWPFKTGFYRFQNEHYFNKKTHCWHRRCQWRFESSLYMYTVKSDHFIWNLWNEPSASFIHLIWNDHHSKILCILWPFKTGFYRFQNEHYFNKKTLTQTLSMTFREFTVYVYCKERSFHMKFMKRAFG